MVNVVVTWCLDMMYVDMWGVIYNNMYVWLCFICHKCSPFLLHWPLLTWFILGGELACVSLF